jgi:uncharacterized repeat protein (TIGR02543 family)
MLSASRLRAIAIACSLVFLAACGSEITTSNSSGGSAPSGGSGGGTPPSSGPFALTVSRTGSGTVTSSPSGIDCGADCTEAYASGTTVSLTATPSAGYTFSGWGGSGISCPGTGACNVSMTAARSVVATFTSTTPGPFTLTVSRIGSGTVTSIPSGIDCGSDCTESYANGSTISLSATPSAGYTFSGWSGSGISCPGTGACDVSMTAARTVTATFSQTQGSNFTLNVTLAGSGTVTSSPAGINCGVDCSESYVAGTQVTLSAVAANGYNFSGWSGSGIACPGANPCAVTMSAARTVIATFASSTPTTNLCDGLVTDKANHPMTALAKPAVGVAVTDPQFGTTIRRISDVGGTDGVIKTAYSTIPAWNADESYLILYHTNTTSSGHHLYDGKTYQHIRRLDIDPPDLEQFYWHTTDPDILFYVNGQTLMRRHISTDSDDPVHTFTCGNPDGGSDPMFMSWDSDVIGLRCGSSVLTYRISTNTEGTPATISGSNAPVASASGARVFLSSGGTGQVRDLNMNLLHTLPVDPNEHASLGRLADGTDTHNAVSFDGAFQGSLVVSDMTKPNSTRVVIGEDTGYPYPPGGTHISAIAFKNPGWVAVSIIGDGDGQSVLDNEIVLANTNPGGQVCRVAHHRSQEAQDYWGEPHVVISPSGTRLIFGSDWGGGPTVDAYVVELPSYVP